VYKLVMVSVDAIMVHVLCSVTVSQLTIQNVVYRWRRSEVTLIYYVVQCAGRSLSPVNDPPPASLTTSLQSVNLNVYSGAAQNLLHVRSILIHGRLLSAGSIAELLAAIRQAWMSINSTTSHYVTILVRSCASV